MLAYKHYNPERDFLRSTLCFDLPNKNSLVYMFTEAVKEADFMIGVSYVHRKDQYVKQTGRLRSEVNLKLQRCELFTIEPRDGRTVYHFTTLISPPKGVLSRNAPDKFVRLEFGFSICPKSENVKLEYANL